MNNATKKYLSFDSEEERDENISKLMSLVSRIETLKVLSNLSSEFQEEDVARYDTRISNLRKLMAEILKQYA